MSDPAYIIIPCPECNVKNRIRQYDSGKIPVCARCKSPLVTEDEDQAHRKFNDSLKDFMSLPDIGSPPGNKS